MKAKQYAKEFDENPTIDHGVDIAMKFVDEFVTIGKNRSCESDIAWKSVFNEQVRKWEAFCRCVKTHDINPELFNLALKAMYPELYPLLVQVS